jgi:hypothetical protein
MPDISNRETFYSYWINTKKKKDCDEVTTSEIRSDL